VRSLAALVLLVPAAVAFAQGRSPAPVEVPLALPIGQPLIVEHRDVRQLPDGSNATFAQQHQLVVRNDGDVLNLTYQPLSARCDGPASICAAFMDSLGVQPGPVYHYQLDAAGQIVPLGLTAPYISPSSSASPMVVAREAAVPGAVLAADLRLLMRFAGVPLPPLDQPAAAAEGRLTTLAILPDSVTVRIDRPTTAATSGLAMAGRAECEVNRATGLISRCAMTDWLGEDAARPVRQRTITVRQATGPVS
jgi:hypothetical protein